MAGLLSNVEENIKKQTVERANQVVIASIQAMNRKDRRKISKANNGIKIPGTNKPFIKIN